MLSLIYVLCVMGPLTAFPTYPVSSKLTLNVHDLDSRTTHLRFDYTYLKLCPAPTSIHTLKK